jgi:peptide-methionine (S)-S-oxide reductase
LRGDRLSSYEQWSLGLEEALNVEFHHGMRVVQSGDMFGGLERFTKTVGHQGTLRHVVLGTPMLPPFPAEMETVLFGMGRFWGPERRFWQVEGVYTTAVGYAGGDTRRATDDVVASGRSGDAQVVRVVFDPRKTSFETLLRLFWEGHDPTQGARQGDDVGTQYRSVIYCSSEAQRQAAEASRDVYGRALAAAGLGSIATEILPAPEFHYAEDAQQQYLAKNPGGYGGLRGTGIRFDPTGTR